MVVRLGEARADHRTGRLHVRHQPIAHLRRRPHRAVRKLHLLDEVPSMVELIDQSDRLAVRQRQHEIVAATRQHHPVGIHIRENQSVDVPAVVPVGDGVGAVTERMVVGLGVAGADHRPGRLHV